MKKKLSKIAVVITLCMFVVLAFGNTYRVEAATKWHSESELGFNGFPEYYIKSINGNTIRYRTIAKWISEDQVTFTRWKTAKLTQSTKYYKGNNSRFEKESEKFDGEDINDFAKCHYLKKVNKKSLIAYHNKSTDAAVRIKVSKGNVKVICFNVINFN